VLFLCSDHASFVTGGELKVEGGYLAMGGRRQGGFGYREGSPAVQATVD